MLVEWCRPYDTLDTCLGYTCNFWLSWPTIYLPRSVQCSYLVIVAFAFWVPWLFGFHHFEFNATDFGWMQYFNGFRCTRFAGIFGVAAILVRQHVHIDQIAESTEYIVQHLWWQRLWQWGNFNGSCIEKVILSFIRKHVPSARTQWSNAVHIGWSDWPVGLAAAV